MIAGLLFVLFGLASFDKDAMERTPTELVRAAPDRWKGFFDDDALQANLTALPEEVRQRVGQAQNAYRTGDFPYAVRALFEALEAEPDLPPAWILLGTTYFRLRRYADAAHAFERFLEVAPGQAWRTQGLAHCYYSLGRWEEAAGHYELVLQRVPDSVEAVRGLALARLRMGEEEEALALFDRVLELDPVHAGAHTWKARVLYELERSEEALPHAERACELTPWDPAPWYQRMQVLFDLDRVQEAEALEERWRKLDTAAQEIRKLEGFLRSDPRKLEWHARLCDLYLEVGDVGSLRAGFERMLALRPGSVSPVTVHGQAIAFLLRAKDFDGARAWAEGLERSFSDDPEAWRVLRDYFVSRGDSAAKRRAEQRLHALEAR